MEVKEGKYTMRGDPEKCTGCLVCALECSFLYEGRFSPSDSRIIINKAYENSIIFAPECTRCGVCADACPFGALTKS